jgi:putative ABC transport system permease protein
MSAGLTPGIGEKQILTGQVLLAGHLSRAPLSQPATEWAGLTTRPQQVTDHYPPGLGSDNTYLGLAYRTGLRAHVRVVAGVLPGGSPAPGPATTALQVAVTQATARRFGLAVGSMVPVPGDNLVLRVAGIVRPAGPGQPFWTYDPLMLSPVLETPPTTEPYWQGEAFIGASGVLALQSRVQQTQMQVTYMFPLSLSRLTATQALSLSQQLPQLLASAGTISVNGGQFPMNVSLTSSFAALIAGFTAANSAVNAVLDLLSVSLAVVSAAVVLLAAWLLAEKRREEFAVLRARGASGRQLALLALRGTAIAAVPGVAAGAAVAVTISPGGTAPLGWWLAGLILAVAVAGPVLITVLAHRRVAGPAGRPDAASGRIAATRRLVAEAGLTLAAAGGLVVLRDQGQGSGDLYACAAPVLVAIPVAIILLRIYPLVVRGLLRTTGGRAGPTAFLGLARAARVPAGAILPSFAMVLALALVCFAGMARGAIVRGEVAASWQQTGSDAVVLAQQQLSAAQLHALAAAPGASRLLPVSLVTGTVGSGQFTALIASPRQYASYTAAAPLPAVPAAFASARPGAGAVPVLASAVMAAELGKGPVQVTVAGQQLKVKVVGPAVALPAAANIGGSGSGGYLVVPAFADAAASAPDTALVLGPALDGSALRGIVQRQLPGASLVLRSAQLQALEQAPLQRGAYRALALSGDAAAVASMLVLLLTLLMSAGSRQLTLARMSTMGFSAGQGRRLAVIEAMPQLIAVLAGGLCCGLILAPLVGPALSLSVFTGSPAPVRVLIEPAWLLGTGAGLLVLALVVLTGQTILASRGTPRSLRIGS